ncbi:type III pantothenate kinase [Candidatus Omnitrophota bacterium]
MLLAIDIGNTNIDLGLFPATKRGGLAKRYSLPTVKTGYGRAFKRICIGKKIDSVIICSVVPRQTELVMRSLKGSLKVKPLIIGRDIHIPIKNLYRRPKEVGEDRLVNAYAGSLLYGRPLVMADFGTAVTFDMVSSKGAYMGGMIIPGLRLSLEALAEKTALLPKIKLSAPKEFIGRDTRSSILSGLIFGFAALTDDLVSRIKREIGQTASVIGTGGNIGLIAGYCKSIDRVDKDLTLKGLNLAYRNSR